MAYVKNLCIGPLIARAAKTMLNIHETKSFKFGQGNVNSIHRYISSYLTIAQSFVSRK